MYCKADFKSIAKCKKWLCAAVFSLFLKNMRRAANLVLQSRCKAILAPPQSTPKNTKTGRKSVGFLILTQAPKCTRSHCFPPQKHPKNGFVMRFAGKNSFLQVRSAHVLILSALSHPPPQGPLLPVQTCKSFRTAARKGQILQDGKGCISAVQQYLKNNRRLFFRPCGPSPARGHRDKLFYCGAIKNGLRPLRPIWPSGRGFYCAVITTS